MQARQKLVKKNLFKIDSSTKVNELSNFYFSYLGDAFFELWCRQKILQRLQNRKLVHNNVVKLVRCQTQAKIAEILQPYLTVEERKIYHQGRNQKVVSRPKHASIKEYRAATGFECFVGYFYFTKKTNRFEELMNKTDLFNKIESFSNIFNKSIKTTINDD